ncbi:MAG TPA: light-harvesting antenna LH1, beta subunit [Gemmatirosa sp.]
MTAPIVTQSTVAGSSGYATGYEPTARPSGPVSGLSEDEARGFHTAFTMSFLGFLLIAIIAHYLVWQWRPWIPGARGYPTRTAQTAPAVKAAPAALQVAYVNTSH